MPEMPELLSRRERSGVVQQREPRGRAAAAGRAVDLAVGEDRDVLLHQRRPVSVQLRVEDHAVDALEPRFDRIAERLRAPRARA